MHIRFRAKFSILAFYPFSFKEFQEKPSNLKRHVVFAYVCNGKLGKSGTVDCLYLNPDNNPWMCMCSSPSSHISFHHLNLSDSEPPCGWSDGFTGEIKCRKTYAKHPNFYGNNLHIFMSKNQKNTASIFKKSLDEFLFSEIMMSKKSITYWFM